MFYKINEILAIVLLTTHCEILGSGKECNFDVQTGEIVLCK